MDVFGVLGMGISFDKRRFSQDVAVFDKAKRTKTGSGGAVVPASMPAVDFFSTDTPDMPVQPVTDSISDLTPSTEVDVVDGEVDGEEDADFSTEEELNVFRKRHRIRVYGSEVPPPFRSFKHLQKQHQLNKYLISNLLSSGYTAPTPIQMQAMGVMLAKRDLIACAPTGSGKTVAFLVPLLQALQQRCKTGIRAVIVSPTRELAQQIHRECEKLCGNGIRARLLAKSNVGHAEKKFDILISTPLRLVNALKEESVDLSSVVHLVVDEADKLFEMGFIEQLDEIIAACQNPAVQKSLFSATITSHVETLAGNVMKDPIRVVIGQKNAATELIDQQLLYVGQEEGKMVAVRQMIQQGFQPPCLIFVESITRAKELFHELVYDGINVDIIHSDRTQAQRDTVIKNFRAGVTWVLIATDLIGRGIDFKGVNLVVNYDFPQTAASYIHRIGRTGRAGRPGKAITYFTKQDGPHLRTIANVMRESGCDVPEWMLNLPKASRWKAQKEKKKKYGIPPSDQQESTTDKPQSKKTKKVKVSAVQE